MSFLYTAFGLGIKSDLPIPGLESQAELDAIDLNIWQAEVPVWMRELEAPTGPPWRSGLSNDQNGQPIIRAWKFSRDEGTFVRVRYQSGNEFILDKDTLNVWVVTREPRSPEYNALYLLGPILALILRLRGVVCLHGSAVVVDDKAIAFVGAPGAGKSTTAAAFARAGYHVLADDVVALLRAVNGFLVLPAYPRLRLWAESAAGLFGPPVLLPLLAPEIPKHYLDLVRDGRFRGDPTPLDAIYELAARVEYSGAIGIQLMSPREGLMTGIKNTFASYILDRAGREAEFQFLGDVAARVPVLRLSAGDDLAKLDAVVDAVARDVHLRLT